MYPQISQNADMNTPASEKGTGVLADSKSETPANLGDMLNPDDKFKPKKMTSIRRAGIWKSAEYRGLQAEMAEAYIVEMEKEAIGLGLAAKAVGSRLLGKGGGGIISRITSVPKVLGRAYRSKVKPTVQRIATRGAATRKAAGPMTRPASMQGAAGPLQKARPVGTTTAPTKAPASISPKEFSRMQEVQAKTHTKDPIFQSLLGKEQTGMEKFYQKYKTPIDIAPWLALPLASQMAGLGPIGDIAAFGGAMALPGIMGRKFGGGLQRATKSYLKGANAPSLKPAMA